MKKILFFTVALCLVASSAVFAHDVTGRIGLGFVSSDAPIGGRYWLNEKLGLDAGIGFTSMDTGNDTNTTFVINAGLPIVLQRMNDRVNFYIRPGLEYTSLENGSTMDISGDLEFEVFVTDDFSVSASHGVAVMIVSPDQGDSRTNFGTRGANWTNFGFHYYLKNQ